MKKKHTIEMQKKAVSRFWETATCYLDHLFAFWLGLIGTGSFFA
jgi:hypothetical protein